MAYNAQLADRVESILKEYPTFSKKKMFGGLCFLLSGNMCCGVIDDKLMARIDPEEYESALEEDHVIPMDFTGRPLKGMIYILPSEKEDSSLEYWVGKAIAFAHTLPKKHKSS